MAKILFATTAEGTKFYPVTITDAVVHIKGNTQTKLSELLDNIDYTGKADKVSDATNGNFAGLDSNGNLTDSGYKATDFQAAGSYKTTQTAVADPTASGNAVSFIDSISQNTNGEISVTKKTIPTVVASTSGAGGNAGLMTAAQAEALAAIDYSGKADKVASATNGNFAGLDSNGNLTDSGKNAADFDVAGAAAAVLGLSGDAASANTVYGAKAYADSLVVGGIIFKDTISSNSELPTTGYKQGWEYAVDTDGTYAGKALQAGDFLIAKKDYESGDVAANVWAVKQGTVAVTNAGADLVIGTATQIATVEGVNITVKQVEDMTKIEAVAVADTSDYADVTDLFTAPAGD